MKKVLLSKLMSSYLKTNGFIHKAQKILRRHRIIYSTLFQKEYILPQEKSKVVQKVLKEKCQYFIYAIVK